MPLRIRRTAIATAAAGWTGRLRLSPEAVAPRPHATRACSVVLAGMLFALLTVPVWCTAPADAAEPLNFPREVGIDIANVSSSVVCLDIDGDGDLEIAAGTAGGSVAFYLLSASNRFIHSGVQVVDGEVVDLVLMPREEPLTPVLVVATANPDQIVLMSYQNPYPFVQELTRIPLEEDPGLLAVGPVGADGATGLAVPYPGSDQLVLINGEGDQWQQTQCLATGDQPLQAVLIDLEDNGVPEIVTADAGALSAALSVFRQDGLNQYYLDDQLSFAGVPRALYVYDQDGDTIDELFLSYADQSFVTVIDAAGGTLVPGEQVTTPMAIDGLRIVQMVSGELTMLCWSRPYEVANYFLRVDDVWELKASLYTGGEAADLYTGDLDGDTYLDLIVANGIAERVAALFGNDVPSFWGYLAAFLPGEPLTAEVVDLDGDTNLDVVVSLLAPPTLEILHGDGHGNLSRDLSVPVPEYVSALAVAHLDADEWLDLAILQTPSNQVLVLLGQPDGGFTQSVALATGDLPYQVFAADVDADGNLDLTIANKTSDDIVIWFGAGDGSFPDLLTVPLPINLHSASLLDLDNDNRLDLAVSGVLPYVKTAINVDGRSFAAFNNRAAGVFAGMLATADIDGDLDDDLVVVNQVDALTTAISMLENTGQNMLIARLLEWELSAQPVYMCAHDIDVDNRQDLLVTYQQTGAAGAVINADDWVFTTSVDFPATPQPIQSHPGDFNGDDVPDFVVLDAALQIALVMLNVEPNAVAVAPPVLAVECVERALDVRFRPGEPDGWLLEAWTDTGWRGLASPAMALYGDLNRSGDTWVLRLNGADAAAIALSAGAEDDLLFRLDSGAGDRHLVAAPADCFDAALEPLSVPLAVSRPQPNPFNPRVTVDFELALPASVRVTVVDLAGKQVALLSAGERAQGRHTVAWDGRGARGPAGAGTYFLLVATEDRVISRKITLLR